MCKNKFKITVIKTGIYERAHLRAQVQIINTTQEQHKCTKTKQNNMAAGITGAKTLNHQ